jgi:hypothetical protein
MAEMGLFFLIRVYLPPRGIWWLSFPSGKSPPLRGWINDPEDRPVVSA